MHSFFHFLYIDPGTGSMLFTIVIGIIAALSFAFKNLIVKIKFIVSGGKIKEGVQDRISYVIFSEGNRYRKIFEPILDEFEERKIPCEYWTSEMRDVILDKEYKYVKRLFIGEGNRAFAKLNMMNACVCLATTPGLDVFQWKRSKKTSYYVHIFHSLDDGTIYRMFALDYYDAILAPADFVEPKMRALEKMRNLPAKDIETVGCTYMDELYSRIGNTKRDNTDKKTILLAPSWGETALLKKYGTEIIEALVKTGYDIVIRPHPQSKKSENDMIDSLEKKFSDVKNVSWNYDSDNFDILNKADILISDFSAVVFDFALIFNKPIIYADISFDKSVYDAAWFDEMPWTLEILPKIGKKLDKSDFSEIKEIIDSMLGDDEYAERRKELRKSVPANLGSSASAIVDYLVKKQNELTENGEVDK